MMIVMMYVLVNVPSVVCGGVLWELTFQPTHYLRHSSRLILFPCSVLQLMLLAGSAGLLRLNELRVVTLNVVGTVDNRLVMRWLLIVIGHQVNDVTLLDIGLQHFRMNRRHDQIAIQHLRIILRRRVSRIVPWCYVSRLPEIRRSRFDRCLGKRHGMMVALPNRFVILRSRLTRLQWRLTVLIIMIRGL